MGNDKKQNSHFQWDLLHIPNSGWKKFRAKNLRNGECYSYIGAKSKYPAFTTKCDDNNKYQILQLRSPKSLNSKEKRTVELDILPVLHKHKTKPKPKPHKPHKVHKILYHAKIARELPRRKKLFSNPKLPQLLKESLILIPLEDHIEIEIINLHFSKLIIKHIISDLFHFSILTQDILI